jgi:hypothetical protein
MLFLQEVIVQVAIFFHWLYSPRGPWSLFQFHDHFTDGRTPWASDQLVARLLPKHTHTQTPNIHALWDPTEPTIPASERAKTVSSCLRPRGYCDRHKLR